MKLVACKVCKDQVADNAPTCPECGTPLPGIAEKKDKKEVTFSLLWILVMLGLSWAALKTAFLGANLFVF